MVIKENGGGRYEHLQEESENISCRNDDRAKTQMVSRSRLGQQQGENLLGRKYTEAHVSKFCSGVWEVQNLGVRVFREERKEMGFECY